MPGISQKVLTQQLRELVSDGLVQRQPTGALPAPVEYSLTDYGRSLLPLVEDVRLWGNAHMARVTAQADAPAAGGRSASIPSGDLSAVSARASAKRAPGGL
jgi:DNA-binding HxlR family transcriptional regulator